MKPYSFYFPYIFVFLCLLYQPSNCQQPYQKNLLDCSQNLSTTASYSCNISESSCQSFVTFRSRPPYDSPISIARLLTSDASGIAFINNISPTSHIPSGKLIIVPLSCSCPRGFYQHNTVYTIQDGSETAFTIANDSYQGLTSCQALNGEFFDQNVFVGYEVVVQLKCACSSTNQTANGVISLLQYLITRGDTVESIANVFGVDKESIFEANMISQDNIFFAFTSLFIPLKNDSCLINPQNFFCYNCPADFPRDARLQASTCDHGKKFPVKIVTLLGTGIGLGFLSICLSGYMLYRFLKNRRCKMRKEKLFKQNGGFLLQQRLLDYGCSERAKIFTEEELQKATDNYNQSRFLGQGGFGTVYKGMLPDGNVVAVKRSKAIDKSQIEQFINEVVILSQVNHRNIVKLLGCCLETEVPVLENQLLEILDTRVAKEAREEDIQSIAELVMRCLRLNGKKRPIMKEVATELEGLIKSQRSLEIDQDQEPQHRRGEMLHMETPEETEQGSIEDSSEFSLQFDESKSL
ncbi:hypothetical protein Pint_21133 [Pistacia integerrima]|uniref:Uncharacterized protein n=1 Tax=Pistacia integerrima TaxID=434235 RepID=A0ACC0XA32_9ROSI|nr:hypothetical protein Pint_21133 [Pistacia integerrima]